MKVFICGGGSGEQTVRAVQRLNEVIRHDLPCLYIPFAMEADQYESCCEWIKGELGGVDIPGIDMVRSAEELARKYLADYSFLFIGGGNTFRLLSEIKRVQMFEPIQEYLRNGGVAFGGSAGAIIFGENLESCALDDDNDVGLKDISGFDVLGGVSFLCHFTNRIPEHDQRSEKYLLEISKHRKVYALPEEDTLFLNETRLEEIGDRPYFVFENGKKTEVPVIGRYVDIKTHYDLLVEENNDPFRDPPALRKYMESWDGQKFLDLMELDQSKTVLEIGVGTGRLAVKTAVLCQHLTGIDISAETIERAKENLRHCINISLICDDFMAHQFTETFDVVYSSLTMMHFQDKRRVMGKIASLLSRNGLFCLSIDKNQNEWIDMGSRKVRIYPDMPESIVAFAEQAGLKTQKIVEVERAYLISFVK